MSREPTGRPLRSRVWFGRQDKMGFYCRSFLKNDGTPQDQFDGKPVIGICNSWSELTPCNQHFRDLTAYGPMVLHVAPEATVGGPLALVRTGDLITLDVPARSLHLHVDEAELARRREDWVPPAPHAARGYAKLYIDHVLQADCGADLDFLVGRTGSLVPRDNH